MGCIASLANPVIIPAMLFTLFGALSGLLLIIADIPYIINAYKRKTQPHRVTWFIVFVLNVISLANQAASGATSSLLFIVGGVIATFSVFLISIPRGVGGHSKLDIAVLAGAIMGLILWSLLDTPLASILANIVVASIALVPTYKKAYLNPKSETKSTWLIGSISAIFAILSVGKLDYVLLLLPVYSLLAQAGLFAILEIRKDIK